MEGEGGTSRGSVQCHVPGCEAFIPNDKAFAKVSEALFNLLCCLFVFRLLGL